MTFVLPLRGYEYKMRYLSAHTHQGKNYSKKKITAPLVDGVCSSPVNLSAVYLLSVLASMCNKIASAARKSWPMETAAFHVSEVILKRPDKQRRLRGRRVGMRWNLLSISENISVGLYF